MASGPSTAGMSVRNLYTPPQEEWLFLPPNVTIPPGTGPSKAGVSSGSKTSSSSTSNTKPYSFSYPQSSSTSPNSSNPLPTDQDDLPESLSSILTPYTLLQIFTSEYLTTALGMPFEVGKTLLQVEYKPKKGVESEEEERRWEEDMDGDGVDGVDGADGKEGKKEGNVWDENDITNPEEASQYFSDLLNSSSNNYRQPEPQSMEGLGEEMSEDPFAVAGARDGEVGGGAVRRDEDGYLEEGHSSYLIKSDVSPSGSTGVWGMMRRVRRTPSEGLPALWKGQLLSTVHSLLSSNIQPIVHSFLLLTLPPSLAIEEINAELSLPLSSHPHPGLPLGLHVASHLITHMFLSPMELLRTRVIAQPSSAIGSQSSPSMLRDMINHEGGIKGLYLDPQLLIPALLEHTIRPIVTLSIPLIIERQLNISPDISPITYSLLDLSLGLASLLIVLPIETVRKRLQLQDRSHEVSPTVSLKGKKRADRKSVVRLRERPYVGVVEAIWRIVTEETGTTPRSRRGKRALVAEKQPGRLDGIKQLYRGFGMNFGAHLTVFTLGIISKGLGGRTLEYGWQEI